MNSFSDPQQLWALITEKFPEGAAIAISGYGGAGKTELGKSLGRDKDGIQLVHVDDYLNWPIVCQPNPEATQENDGIDFDSIVAAHIKPFRSGTKPVKYLIVEGIYLLSPERQAHFDFKIWVDTPIDLANSNGQARDASNQQLWETVWVPNETAFEEKYEPKQYADAIYSWI